MLPSELLRIKITDKGKKIMPLFCSIENIDIAQKLINEFQTSYDNKDTKAILEKNLSSIESEYRDFKLIRGLIVLLERRTVFSLNKNFQNPDSINRQGLLAQPQKSSFTLRKILFEESAKEGLALDYDRRSKILERAASRLGISHKYLEKAMWIDREDNLIVESFKKISPDKLLELYNLSLLQTLFFNCVNFEFSIKGGKEWKYVLRKIKRFGLMYNLKLVDQALEKGKHTFTDILDSSPNNDFINENKIVQNKADTYILCSIDGPLSIFRLTNKYGVLIAKIIPEIIYSCKWNIKAWILKNNSSNRKMYEFELSSDKKYFHKDLREMDIAFPFEFSNVFSDFDSEVEEKFALNFKQLRTGWELIREPEPLVLPKGRAFIADFMFERYDKKIYFEIVGYWTPNYLERKFNKINELLSSSEGKYDFLIAINENNLVSNDEDSRKIYSNSFIRAIDKEKLIIYKRNSIPIKPIIDYLKLMDKIITKQNTIIYQSEISDFINNLMKQNIEIINLEEISKKFSMSLESIIDIVSNPSACLLKEKYSLINTFFILNIKLDEMKKQIADIKKFVEAQKIFQMNKIPDSCHINLIQYFGFEILWTGFNLSDILLEKK